MAFAPSPPRRPARPVPWLLLATLLPVALYAAAGWNALGGGLGLPLDDSWIHLGFARNLASGEGLSFNPGELVTGSTAPLWTALISLFFVLPGDPVAWTLAAGVGLHLAGVHATFRLALEMGLGRGAAVLAAGLTLSTYWVVWSALSGMEIPLFISLSVWGITLHLRERREPSRPALALPVMALSALARPEGVLLAAAALADRLVVLRAEPPGTPARLVAPPWRRLAEGLGLAVLALGPAALFYGLVAGSPLPATYAAKAGGAGGGLPELRFLHLVLGILFKPQPVMALLAPAGALRLVEELGGRRNRGLLPALWVLGLPLAYGVLSPPGEALVGNFGRYFFPLFPPLIILGIFGGERAVAAVAEAAGRSRHRLPVGAALAALVMVPTVLTLLANAGFYATNLANVEASDVRLARWVRENVPPEAVLALEDVGAVGYLTPNRVIDLAGLVTPGLVRRARAAAGPGDPGGDRGVLRYLEGERPDLLAAFTNFRPGLTAHSGFEPLLRIRVADNITMGGDELVLYRTPWSRLGPPPDPP